MQYRYPFTILIHLYNITGHCACSIFYCGSWWVHAEVRSRIYGMDLLVLKTEIIGVSCLWNYVRRRNDSHVIQNICGLQNFVMITWSSYLNTCLNHRLSLWVIDIVHIWYLYTFHFSFSPFQNILLPTSHESKRSWYLSPQVCCFWCMCLWEAGSSLWCTLW